MGVFASAVVSNAALAVIFYLALKRGIRKFRLKTYMLRLNYVCAILLLLLAYNFLIPLILLGELEFPRIGLPMLFIALLVPYFIKK